MPLEKRSGSPFWYARFQIGGRRYFLSSGTASRKEAAEFERRARLQAATELRQIEKARSGPLTVEAAMGRYWHECGQYHKGKDVLRHLEWLRDRAGGKRSLSSLTTGEISKLVAQRRADGVSNATVNRSVVEPLRRVINRARRIWGEPLPEIAWASLRLREASHRIREASKQEEEVVIAGAREEYRAPISFAIRSGFRLAEVVALRWRDIDWQARAIAVKGKGDKAATIPLTSAIEAILRPLRGHHFEFVFTYEKRRQRAGEAAPGTRVPLPALNLYRRFKEACVTVGVDNLRFHDLRHTTGSRITRAGGLRVAMSVLRHADIKTTLRYAHVLDEDIRRAMEAADGKKTASQNRITDHDAGEFMSKTKS